MAKAKTTDDKKAETTSEAQAKKAHAKAAAVKTAAEEETAVDASAKKPAPKGAAKKKGAVTKAAAAGAPKTAEPMIDTNLAAAVAAKRLANRDTLAAAAKPTAGESEEFKQMKENLFKPSGQNVPSFLQTPVGGNKFNNPGGRNQQQGRNQTFGADVNRTGVPRRTGG